MTETFLGKKFKIDKKTTYYILFYEDRNFHGKKIKKGLNKDSSMGFYFLTLIRVGFCITKKVKYIGEIEIYDDSLIKEHFNCPLYETDKFFLKNKVLIKDFKWWNNEDFCLTSLETNVYNFKYTIYTKLIKKKYKSFIKYNGKYIKYIRKENQNYKLCLLAINNNGMSLKYIRKDLKDYYLCMMAVLYNSLSFKYVNKSLQTYELCNLAVNRDANNFRYVKESLQTYELCKIATKELINLKFIRKDLLDKELFEMFINKIFLFIK